MSRLLLIAVLSIACELASGFFSKSSKVAVPQSRLLTPQPRGKDARHVFAQKHQVGNETGDLLSAEILLRRSLVHNPSDAKSLRFGNLGASDTVVDGEGMPTVSCFGQDAIKAAMLPYLRPSSPFHSSFDPYPAELINADKKHCLIRNFGSSGAQRVSMDYSANNIALVCAQNGSAQLPLPPMEHYKIATEDLPFWFVVPPACEKGGKFSPCPLVTALHGVSDLTVFADNVLKSASCKNEMAVILFIPHIDGTMKGHNSWDDLEFLRPLIVKLHQEHAALIDFSRLYLYGQSMGASGAFWGALASPDLFTDAFSISPQHMWSNIPEAEATLTMVTPKWRNRGSAGVRRLRRFFITVGGEDAVKGAHAEDVGIIPRSLSKIGATSAGVSVELRFYPELGHVCWFAAFNELHNIIWLGKGGVPGFSSSVWVLLVVLAIAAILRVRGQVHLPSPATEAARNPLVENVLPVELSGNGHKPCFAANLERASKGGSLLDFLKPDCQSMALGSTEGGKRYLSHAALYQLVAETDLTRFEVATQSKVATVMPAGEQAASLMLALFHRYAVAPLSASLQPSELTSAVERLGIHALVTTPEFAAKFGKALPKSVTLLCADPSQSCAGLFDLTMLRKSDKATDFSSSRCNAPDDIVLLLQTSGTTSAPKVVPVTLYRLILGGMCWADAMNVEKGDVGLNMMPLYHIGGIITNMLAMILFGGGVVCTSSLRDDDFIGWLKQWEVTYYAAVPTMHAQAVQIFEQAGGAPEGLKLKRIATGAAHTPFEVMARLRNLVRVPVVTTYGMTECMPIASAPPDYALWPKETVGKAICGEVGCFGENGEKVGVGQEGELCVKGPLVMKQYLSGGQASLCQRDWFRTGDLCMFDQEGWIYLLGRSKEVINRGGELISPFEIDSAASQHPGVLHCLSFSTPHKELGEAVALAVVPRVGVVLDPNILRLFMLEKLTSVKVPEAIVFVPFIPKGATGKPERIRLAKIIGMEQLDSAGSRTKVFRANFDEASKVWALQRDNSYDDATGQAEDSLGFARKMNSDGDAQAHLVQQALYGLCALKLIWQHWLPATMTTIIPLPIWLCNVLTTVVGCRTLLVLIFPLLGYFDGRAALAGESTKNRFLCMLAIYIFMAWPYLPFAWGFATFHRWPIAVWIYSIAALHLFRRYNLPVWCQVVIPFALAPLFGNMVDGLHALVGLAEHPAGGVFLDPTLLFLEHRFYWSVGAKLYFIGCYMFAYHYLAPRQELLVKATTMQMPARVIALLSFVVLTFIWQSVTPAKDPNPAAIPEVSDWPRFFGVMYPLHAFADWAAMALLVIGVGSGNALLRLLGSSILGTMMCHMWLQLPFADILHASLQQGGAPLVLVMFCLVPIIFNLTIGYGFQCVLMNVGGRVARLAKPYLQAADSAKTV